MTRQTYNMQTCRHKQADRQTDRYTFTLHFHRSTLAELAQRELLYYCPLVKGNVKFTKDQRSFQNQQPHAGETLCKAKLIEEHLTAFQKSHTYSMTKALKQKKVQLWKYSTV